MNTARAMSSQVSCSVMVGRCFRALRSCGSGLIASLALVTAPGTMLAADQDESTNEPVRINEPLDFGFIKKPLGQLIQLESHKLHLFCEGQGEVTVLLEAGLGGNSLEWTSVQHSLAEYARTCSYDRGGYAWSDPSPYARDARQLAREANEMLEVAGIDGPLILVGHSFGGFVIRELEHLRHGQVVGLVLVDASHEDQFTRMETPGGRSMMPRGTNFVISPIDVPDTLPIDVRRKLQAFSRMRKTYAATHGEMVGFRESAAQVKEDRTLLDLPVRVMLRGLDPYEGNGKRPGRNALWRELQEDLLSLSGSSALVVAEGSGHFIHADEPERVVSTIREVIDAYQGQ